MLNKIPSTGYLTRPDATVVYDVNYAGELAGRVELLTAKDPYILLPPLASVLRQVERPSSGGVGVLEDYTTSVQSLLSQLYDVLPGGFRSLPPTPAVWSRWSDIAAGLLRVPLEQQMLPYEKRLSYFAPEHPTRMALASLQTSHAAADASLDSMSDWDTNFATAIFGLSYQRILTSGFLHTTMAAGELKEQEIIRVLGERIMRFNALAFAAHLQSLLLKLRPLIQFAWDPAFETARKRTFRDTDRVEMEQDCKYVLSVGLHPWVSRMLSVSEPTARETAYAPSNPTLGLPRAPFIPIAEQLRRQLGPSETGRFTIPREQLDASGALIPYMSAYEPLALVESLSAFCRKLRYVVEDANLKPRFQEAQRLLACTEGAPVPARLSLSRDTHQITYTSGDAFTGEAQSLADLMHGLTLPALRADGTQTAWVGEEELVSAGPMTWSDGSSSAGRPFPLAVYDTHKEHQERSEALYRRRLSPKYVRPLEAEYIGEADAVHVQGQVGQIAELFTLTEQQLASVVNADPAAWAHIVQSLPSGALSIVHPHGYYYAPRTMEDKQSIQISRGVTPFVCVAYAQGQVIAAYTPHARLLRDFERPVAVLPIEPMIDAEYGLISKAWK